MSAEDVRRQVLDVLRHVRSADGPERWCWVRVDQLAGVLSRLRGRTAGVATLPELANVRRALRRLARSGLVELHTTPPTPGPLEPLKVLDWSTGEVVEAAPEGRLLWARMRRLPEGRELRAPEISTPEAAIPELEALDLSGLERALAALPPLPAELAEGHAPVRARTRVGDPEEDAGGR